MQSHSPFPHDVRVLLAENIAPSANEAFTRIGIREISRVARAVGAQDARELAATQVLGIRSQTKVFADLLAAAPALISVGCFSVGTNQVDLEATRARGIPVFNAPYSNTRSVAELTIGEIVMLFRRVPHRSQAMHTGGWDKSATGAFEVRGKTLGIVGYGSIGAQLSNLAEAMGMRVIFFDVTDKLRHGNTMPTDTLAELLSQSDVVSLHVPETAETNNLIGEAEIRAMRPGAYLINNSRGRVVDIAALAAALADNHLAGAAIDVFPVEPKANGEKFVSQLQGLENVILTPHIGGSTMEAQDRIGEEVSRKLADFIQSGSTAGAVNFPQVQIPTRREGARFLHTHRNVPGVLRQINDAMARSDINVAAQYLQTEGDLGYVVIEADAFAGNLETTLAALQAIPGTVHARLIPPPVVAAPARG
jgi:D-3-phosphoglycerate dehydrogenase / 2-oxoglutarate reductase